MKRALSRVYVLVEAILVRFWLQVRSREGLGFPLLPQLPVYISSQALASL